MAEQKEKTRTQVARLAIVKPDRETAGQWAELSVSVQRLRNRVLVVWRRWHEDRGHGEALAQWMTDLVAWHREKQRLEEASKPAEKPKSAKEKRLVREAKAAVKAFVKSHPKPLCPCSPLPPELGRTITAATTEGFPDLPGLIRSTANKILLDTWIKSPSNKGAFRKWQRCLAGFGELMVFSQAQPIPIHNRHIRLVEPDTLEGDWRVGIKISRVEIDDKSVLPEDVVIVQTKGKKCRKLLGALRMLASGKGKVCGSNLVNEKGRWYLHLVYKQPVDEVPKLDGRRVAMLEPGVDHPWSLRLGDRDDWLVGRNRLLAWHRRRLGMQKMVGREAYRDGKGGKGHGRSRYFTSPRYRNRLAGYKATLAKVSAVRAVSACVRAGYGKLVYCAPTDASKRATFLETAGTKQHRLDTFCWYVFESQLKRNCEQSGIKLDIKPWHPPEDCEGSGAAKTPASPRSGASGDGGDGSVRQGRNGAVKKAAGSGTNGDRSQSRPQTKGRQRVERHAVAKGK